MYLEGYECKASQTKNQLTLIVVLKVLNKSKVTYFGEKTQSGK